MGNPLASQTLINLPHEEVYRVIETVLPNGKKFPQLWQQVLNENGEEDWQLVDEKLKAIDEKRAQLEERYKGTATAPANWEKPATDTLMPKDRETAETLRQGGITRIDLRRALVLALGDPKLIIAQQGLDPARIKRFKEKDPAFLTCLTMMAMKHGGEWAEAGKFLKPPYPMTWG